MTEREARLEERPKGEATLAPPFLSAKNIFAIGYWYSGYQGEFYGLKPRPSKDGTQNEAEN